MREKLVELIEKTGMVENKNRCNIIAEELISNGVTLPVRCKDCIHRVYVDMGDEIGAIGGCELFGMAMQYDAFCSYGERRTDA